MLFLQLFVFCQTAIPPEFADLAQRALDNAMNKTAKSSRETSLNVGFYEGKNIHYKLLNVLTSSNTHDIKGFAKDDKHFAIVKRKAFNLKDDFVFIDPNTEKLFNLKKSVASDDKVSIYESREVSFFDVFTDFEIHTSTWAGRHLSSANDTSKSPSASVKEAFKFEWDTTTNQPVMKRLEGTGMQFGYGAYARIETDLTYSFKSPKDAKLEANIALRADVGCKFVIPDNFQKTFNPIKLVDFDYEIPALKHSSKLLAILSIDIGCYLNFYTELKNMDLEIPVGFNYFKGYSFFGSKSVLISTTTIVNDPWNFTFTDLLDGTSSNSLVESVTSAHFTGIADASLTLKFKLNIGDGVLKAGVDVGLGIPFKYDLKYDKNLCHFPYLSLKLQIPLQFILKVESVEVKILGKQFTIFRGVNDLIPMKEFTLGPLCLATQLYAKQEFQKDGNTFTSKPLRETDGILVYQFPVLSSNTYAYEISFDQLYNGKYLFFEPTNVDVVLENPIFAGEFICCKLDSSPIKLLYKKNVPDQDAQLSVTIVEVLNNFQPIAIGEMVSYTSPTKYSIAAIVPAITFTGLDGTSDIASIIEVTSDKNALTNYKFKAFGDNAIIYVMQFNSNEFYYIYASYLHLAAGQNSITFNYNHMKVIRTTIPGVAGFSITVFCTGKDLKEIIMSNENGKTQKSTLSTDPPYRAEFNLKFADYDDFVFTFMPVCNDETGIMCQITYEVGDTDGYQIIKYPDRDGISTTGQGFLIEAIPITAYSNFNYYKTSSGRIRNGKFYPKGTTYRIQPSITTVNSPLLAGNGQRVCIVNADDSDEILPFSRQYFNNNINEVLELFAKSPDDISSMDLITSDEDGCLLFDSSIALKEEITYLPKEICDIPILQYGTPPDPSLPDDPNPDLTTGTTIDYGVVIPLIIGVVVVIAIIVIVIVVVIKKRKNKQKEQSVDSV